jgi:hypothetical protein
MIFQNSVFILDHTIAARRLNQKKCIKFPLLSANPLLEMAQTISLQPSDARARTCPKIKHELKNKRMPKLGISRRTWICAKNNIYV